MKTNQRRTCGVLAALAVLLFLFAWDCGDARGETADLNSAASKAGIAIKKSVGGSKAVLRAVDFTEEGDAKDQLGHELAVYFGQKIAAVDSRINVLSDSQLLQVAAPDKLAPEGFANIGTMMCYEPQLHATNFISGTVHRSEDSALVEVQAWHLSGWRRPKKIFFKQLTISLTPELQAALSAFAHPQSTAPESDDGIPEMGKNGYSVARCIRCPNPQFTSKSVTKGVDGKVTLRGQISPQGTLENLSIVHGMPCGLTQKAIEAVRTWQLEPSIGPDGKPATVRTTVVIDFHIH